MTRPHAPLFALLLAAGCATAPPYHSCPGPCATGLTCNTSVGACGADPCGGRCMAHEHCVESPSPHCEIDPLGEMEMTRPDTSSPAGSLH